MTAISIQLAALCYSNPKMKAKVVHFSLNECTAIVAAAADYHSVLPSRNANPLLLPLSVSLGVPSPHRGMLGWRDGQRGLLSVVSFSSSMSHPAVSLKLFVTPTQTTQHHQARLAHPHKHILHSHKPHVKMRYNSGIHHTSLNP